MNAELGYLGLGSNLGDRRELLQAAVEDRVFGVDVEMDERRLGHEARS